MRGQITALLIFHCPEPYSDLEAALEKLAVRVGRAETFAEACLALSSASLPLVVFTERELPDGNWADVVALSAITSSPFSVIVLGPAIDIRFYVSVIEGGAFDFITPPFEIQDLAHVVKCAADKALMRRQTVANS